MTPLLLAIAGGLARTFLAALAGWFSQANILSVEQGDQFVEQGTKYVLQYAPILAIALWSSRDKWTKHLRYVAARLLPPDAPEGAVRALARQPEIRELAFVDSDQFGTGTPIPPPNGA